MKRDDLEAAIQEAKRFIQRAEELKVATVRTDEAWKGPNITATHRLTYFIDNPREQGAVKRASMDLTRALAHLRRRT
jgi:hypothetical protein